MIFDEPLVVDHEAAILDNINPRSGELLGELVIKDAKLKPDSFGMFLDQLCSVHGQLIGPTENVDKIDFTGNVEQAAINRLPQHRRRFGFVYGYRNELESGLKKVCSDEMCGQVGKLLASHTEYGYPARAAKQATQPFLIVDDIVFPVFHRVQESSEASPQTYQLYS